MFNVFGFYKFKKIKNLKKIKKIMHTKILNNKVRGTIILSKEGINFFTYCPLGSNFLPCNIGLKILK